jgi:hypothetical protein
MPHQRAQVLRTGSIKVRAAAIFFVGATVAYWLAPKESAELTRAEYSWTPTSEPDAARRDEIQQLLAQGGCPGWLVLANEPDALRPPGQIAPSRAWRETAARVPNPPRVKYPVPLRVASRPADDELISEEEDLLLTSPEMTGREPSSAAVAGERTGSKRARDAGARTIDCWRRG